MKDFYENPILNSPYEYPKYHWELDENGKPTKEIKNSRREVDFVTPIAPPVTQRGQFMTQQELILDSTDKKLRELGEGYHRTIINEVRKHVNDWRAITDKRKWGVSAITARLLSYWRNFDSFRGDGFRPFFCQLEAVETAIWLTEVAPNKYREYLKNANEEANPGLNRLALKLATGAGKTVVMAMLIAWQTLNAVRNPARKNFTKGFLVVTPGITIKDRLRVLLPNDPESYYKTKRLVPDDMLGDMQNASVVITNFHAFRRQEKLDVSPKARKLLNGWGDKKEISTIETEGEMLRRVIPSLMSMKNVMVINDEAHHCYREKVNLEEELVGAEAEEAEENNDTARVWISGLEIVQKKIGILRVFDLSATPFFLRGSGYEEGHVFPWIMSDFSLMDAIECGIVKLPRVPVSDNDVTGKLIYRDLWENIREKMPRMGRKKAGDQIDQDPESLPKELKYAIETLYKNYEAIYEDWKDLNVDPCFVIVCANTTHSKLIYDYVSGYSRKHAGTGQDIPHPAECELFSNYDENGKPYARPRTLLIDSRQLESGEALTDEFRKAAKDEIERFKREKKLRGGNFSSKTFRGKDDAAEILREVMNTVGKPGRLGGGIRCVVSVSMLTEGWDANTVTHILGVRAFSTQLLCEQVVGRALRRYSYDQNDEGLFDVEYSNIFGVPFKFVAPSVVYKPRPPVERVHVCADPERSNLEIIFPRVVGFRREFLRKKISAKFNKDSRYILTLQEVGATKVKVAGLIGAVEEMGLEHLENVRENTILMCLTKHILSRKEFCDAYGVPKLYLFGQVYAIVKKWFKEYFVCCEGTYPAQICYKGLADDICQKIVNAITRAEEENAQTSGLEPPIRVLLDPFCRVGSTQNVDFYTARKLIWETSKQKAHLNFHVCDSTWEKAFCSAAENNPRVKAYVKNQGMGFEVPYMLGGTPRRYVPDFILLVDDGHGEDDLLHLVVEIKGYRGEDAKAKKDVMETCWVPGINRLREFGRWKFLEITEPYDMGHKIEMACRKRLTYELENLIAQKNA